SAWHRAAAAAPPPGARGAVPTTKDRLGSRGQIVALADRLEQLLPAVPSPGPRRALPITPQLGLDLLELAPGVARVAPRLPPAPVVGAGPLEGAGRPRRAGGSDGLGALGAGHVLPGVADRGRGPVPGPVAVAGVPVAPQLGIHLGPRAAAVLGPVAHLPGVAVVRLVLLPARPTGAEALLPARSVAGHHLLPALGPGAVALAEVLLEARPGALVVPVDFDPLLADGVANLSALGDGLLLDGDLARDDGFLADLGLLAPHGDPDRLLPEGGRLARAYRPVG